MARLQTSGTISLDDVRNTFGLTGAISMNSLYRGGPTVPDTPQHSGYPTSSTIAFDDLYGGDLFTTVMTPATVTLDEGASTAPTTGITGGGSWLAFVFSSADIPTTTSRDLTFTGEPNTTYNITYTFSTVDGPAPTFWPNSVTTDASGSTTVSVEATFNTYTQTEGTVTITSTNSGDAADTAQTGPHNYELAI
jgi:hypothetical protein